MEHYSNQYIFVKWRLLYLNWSGLVESFVNWLTQELNDRDWSQNRLAKEAGLSSSAMSRVMNGDQPSFEICKSIARALKVMPETVLYMSGLLPKPPGYNPKADELQGHFAAMGEDDQDELLHISRGKIERRKGKRNGKKQTERA